MEIQLIIQFISGHRVYTGFLNFLLFYLEI